ncbi:MAG: amidase family protein [Myxococcota bacterium]|nr:amidase family protein [Myxococcota bacterium]
MVAVVALSLLSVGVIGVLADEDKPSVTPYRWMDALQTREALRSGRCATRDIIQQSEALIGSEDRGPNGFRAVIRLTNHGRSASHPSLTSPLAGLPIIVKDNIAIRGEPTTAGSLALAKNVALTDADVVAQIRAAGGVIFARANLSEWANFRDSRSTSGWSSVGGQTNHAYNPTRNPCGSSAGSAVAVARGYAPLAVGTETCGSIICPAATNGVVGIKPSRGLVSGAGIVPISKTFDVAGPIARRVADAALLLSVMVKPEYDTLALKIRKAGMRPRALSGLRLGVVTNLGLGHVGTTRAFEQFQASLRRRGVVLVDVVLPHMDAISVLFGVIVLHEFKRDLNQYLGTRTVPGQVRDLADLIAYNAHHADSVMPHFGQDRLVLAQRREAMPSEQYHRDLARLLDLAGSAGIDHIITKYRLDGLIAPSNRPAWLSDYRTGDAMPVSSALPAAVAGYPAVTVPMAKRDGLPVGVTVWGRAKQDAQIIAIAAAIERMTGGFKRP